MIVNAYEHKKLHINKLPDSWKDDGVLDDFEKFLQNNWQQRVIFYSDGHDTTKQQFIDFNVKNGVKLKNYIGTIIYKGDQLNIFPKIFKVDIDDDEAEDLQLNILIDNLVIWLEYCDKLNFPFVSLKGELKSSENLMELFITIYVHYAKNVIDLQRYYRYEEVVESGEYLKGKLDVKDYVISKYPRGMLHKMRYEYSDFKFDNKLNRIIKFTCKTLISLTEQSKNKHILRNILGKLNDVSDITCLPYDCDMIHLSALENKYNVILMMSKMFLFNQMNAYNMGNMDAFCFLFPAEILFEGFISGFLKEILSDKAIVKTQASDQYLADLVVDNEIIGDVFRLKEDILVKMSEDIYILDIKYKEIEPFHKVKENKKLGISDNDIKQMAIYASKRGAKKLYLIYPLFMGEEPEKIKVHYNIKLDENIVIPLEVLKVPFVIADDVDLNKHLLREILGKILQ